MILRRFQLPLLLLLLSHSTYYYRLFYFQIHSRLLFIRWRISGNSTSQQEIQRDLPQHFMNDVWSAHWCDLL
jgi:hypothetical protein